MQASPLSAKTAPFVSRLGILSMILCFALGIANVFTIHPLIIVFSAICLYVFFSSAL